MPPPFWILTKRNYKSDRAKIKKKKEPLYFRFIERGTGNSKCNSIGYIWLYVTNSICENKRTNVVVIHRNWGAVGIIIWINDFMSLSIRFVHLSPRWISFSRSTLDFGLVLTGGYYHDLERYHDFAVEIMYSENRWFLLQNHDNALNHDKSLQQEQAHWTFNAMWLTLR